MAEFWLQVFRGLLGLSGTFSADELESVLVASVGDDGLLPDVHMVGCLSLCLCFPAADWHWKCLLEERLCRLFSGSGSPRVIETRAALHSHRGCTHEMDCKALTVKPLRPRLRCAGPAARHLPAHRGGRLQLGAPFGGQAVRPLA